MKKLSTLLLVMMLMTSLVGCGTKNEDDHKYQLYFTVDMAYKSYGEAIEGEHFLGNEERASVASLLNGLFAGPTSDGLTNPFPQGTSLLWFSQIERGVVRINLSEEYNALTGVSLTLADYCIVRTLCQLDEVSGVEIYTANEPNPFRNGQVLTIEDVT